MRARSRSELPALAGHLVFGLFDEALHHVAADVTGLTGGQVAVIALLEVDAKLARDFIFHVVQRAPWPAAR